MPRLLESHYGAKFVFSIVIVPPLMSPQNPSKVLLHPKPTHTNPSNFSNIQLNFSTRLQSDSSKRDPKQHWQGKFWRQSTFIVHLHCLHHWTSSITCNVNLPCSQCIQLCTSLFAMPPFVRNFVTTSLCSLLQEFVFMYIFCLCLLCNVVKEWRSNGPLLMEWWIFAILPSSFLNG